MTEHTISLPERVYHGLLAAAQAEGLSPAKWIALQLAPDEVPQSSNEVLEDPSIRAIDSKGEPVPRNPTEVDKQAQPLFDLLNGLAGVIDSKAEPCHSSEPKRPYKEDAFGESFITEMAEQGIHLP